MNVRERAEALVRATRSLGDAALRASYVSSVVRAWAEGASPPDSAGFGGDIATLARTLDVVCERAEQAGAGAREVLVAIVDALNTQVTEDVVQRLREQAAGESLLALERLVRQPMRALDAPPAAVGGRVERVLADGRGRPLTLGERKSLARRPDRDTMQRLLLDPHPDVIRRCLHNPRVTEDDVVRLAAKRPGRGEVLAEIARAPKWVHRPRVRVALVMNPATPAEISARIAGLLLRPELELVARSPGVPAEVRAVCIEHLDRRPPVDTAGDDERVH